MMKKVKCDLVKITSRRKATDTYTTCPYCGYEYAKMTNKGLYCPKCCRP